MKVSELTLNAIKPFVTGDDSAQVTYMSGPNLIKFFNAFGFNDAYTEDGLPNGWSRNAYAYERLKELNGTGTLKAVIEALADDRKVDDLDLIAESLSSLIKHDGYRFEKNENGIYKVARTESEDPILVEAHFQEIKKQIIDSIESAKFTIWIAVAWFTDKDIGNRIRERHLAGANVRIIVNDDDITYQHGLPFDKKGIEYHRVSPNSPWGKKLMHNKFCIIDFYKVIHGSYNWTSNAKYNNESITIIENRELAEDFASQFIELINQSAQ